MNNNNFFKKIWISFKRIFSNQKTLEAPKQEYSSTIIDYKTEGYYENEKDEQSRISELYKKLKEDKLDIEKLSLTDLKRVDKILQKQIEIEKMYMYSGKSE